MIHIDQVKPAQFIVSDCRMVGCGCHIVTAIDPIDAVTEEVGLLRAAFGETPYRIVWSDTDQEAYSGCGSNHCRYIGHI